MENMSFPYCSSSKGNEAGSLRVQRLLERCRNPRYLTGKQIWSSSISFRSSIFTRSSGKFIPAARSSRRSMCLQRQRSRKSIIGDGAEIYGEMEQFRHRAQALLIGKGAVVHDSIIMKEASIGAGCSHRPAAIIAENSKGRRKCCDLREGEDVPNKLKPKVYSFGLVTIGEDSVIPAEREDRQEYRHFRRDHTGGLSGRSTGKR